MKSDFLIAVTQLAAERNLPRDMVISAVEAALVSAYKKNSTPGSGDIKVVLDPNSGDVSVFQLKTVVAEIEDESTEMTLAQAKRARKGTPVAVGDVLEFQLEPQLAGRIEAQTAKQVVIQRLREAERELVFAEFSGREGEVFTGTVQRSEARYGGPVTLDLNGRAEAILPHEQQSPYDRYRPGAKVKVMVSSVERTSRGPEIIVTRAEPGLLRRLFEMEVPEIYNGIVEIRAIAREAGSRSKVAVMAAQDGVDPVGACVGLRGIRIQNIVNELQGEKIDVIQWSRDPAVFLSNALSPAQPLRVDLSPDERSAVIVVQDRQLTLSIGREGQNARLASKLTGWNIDIKSSAEIEYERLRTDIEEKEAAASAVAVAAPEDAADAPGPAEPIDEVASELNAMQEIAAVIEPETEAAPAMDADIIGAPDLSEPVPTPGGLSAEEILALESLELANQQQAAEPEEVVEEAALDEDLWKMPEASGGLTGIRFAEDIMGDTPRGGGRRRGGARRAPQRPPNRRGGAPPTSRP